MATGSRSASGSFGPSPTSSEQELSRFTPLREQHVPTGTLATTLASLEHESLYYRAVLHGEEFGTQLAALLEPSEGPEPMSAPELHLLVLETNELYDCLRLRFHARHPDSTDETQMLLLLFECRRLLLKAAWEAVHSAKYSGFISLRVLWQSRESEFVNYIFTYLSNGMCPTPLVFEVTRDLVDAALSLFREYVSIVIGCVPIAPCSPLGDRFIDSSDSTRVLVREFQQTRQRTSKGRQLSGADFRLLKQHARELSLRLVLRLCSTVECNVSAHTLPQMPDLDLQKHVRESLCYLAAVCVGQQGWLLKGDESATESVPQLNRVNANELLEAYVHVFAHRVVLRLITRDDLDDPHLGLPHVLLSLLGSEIYRPSSRAQSSE